MTRKEFSAICAGCALAPSRLFAQDAQSILAGVANVYKELPSYQFEGKSISKTTMNGKTTSSEVGFFVAFQAPDKFRLEFRYPGAGEWVRMSNGEKVKELRSATKESTLTQATPHSLRALRGSPIYPFERLAITAMNPHLMRSELLAVNGKEMDCHLIEFTAGRRHLRDGEQHGLSMVWVAKSSSIVLREDVVTLTSSGEKQSENRHVTIIEKFQINESLPRDLFILASGNRFYDDSKQAG